MLSMGLLPWIGTIGLILAGFIVLISVGAWGIVQCLDVMEAMDLRRQAKARELKKAREYLTDPGSFKTTSTGTASTPNVSVSPNNTWS